MSERDAGFNDGLVAGVFLGIAVAYIVAPGLSWLLLRLSDNARRRFHYELSTSVDAGVQGARVGLSQDTTPSGRILAGTVEGVVIPAIRGLDGRPWSVIVHQELSRRAADAVIAKMRLPKVENPL